jgi:hypothetical protein
MNLSTYIAILSDIAGKPFDYPTQVKARELIITARQALIRQQYEKTRTFPTSSLVSLCIEVEEKSSTECCGIDLGCNLVISKKEIPLPIDVKDEVIFEFVGDIIGMFPFGYLKPSEVPLIKYRKFTSKLPYYTWINKRLVYFNVNGLEKSRIRYVPANPVELTEFIDCETNKPCFDLESNSFIEGHWEDAITKMVLPKIAPNNDRQIKVNEDGTA